MLMTYGTKRALEMKSETYHTRNNYKLECGEESIVTHQIMWTLPSLAYNVIYEKKTNAYE